MRRLACLALVAVALAGAWISGPPVWELYHQDSIALSEGYFETWIVLESPPIRPAIWMNGEPMIVEWTGPVGACSSFAFTSPELDYIVPIEARVANVTVWSGDYGAGAGTPIQTKCS